MDDLQFSVVIPTCDRPDMLIAAIESVSAQSYSALEIIVVDNGRVPLPTDIASDARIRYIRALPRFGVSQARNVGAIAARGTHIAFLDDDDAWCSSYLQAVRDCYRRTGAAVILGGLRDMESAQPLRRKHEPIVDSKDYLHQLFWRNPGAVGSNTVVLRDEFISREGYDPFLTVGQDKALVLEHVLNGASVARAEGAWVEFRADWVGERQTDIRKHLQGSRRFLAKYWHRMSWKERFLNYAVLGRLRLRYLRETFSLRGS